MTQSAPGESDEIRALRDQLAGVIKLLGLMWDKWENGDDCYVEPELQRDWLGKAFRLSDAEQDAILAALATADEKKGEG